MFRMRSLILMMVGTLLAAMTAFSMAGQIAVSEKVTFKNTDKNTDAKDFAISVKDGKFRLDPDPESNKFATTITNNNKDPALVVFQNGTVAKNGGTHDVRFRFFYDDKTNPMAEYKFDFSDAKGKTIPKAAEIVALSGLPAFNGPNFSLVLANQNTDTGVGLTGSVSVYENPGSLDNQDTFDQLNPGNTLVYSNPNYSLPAGDMISPPITGTLPANTYLLVIGTANDGSGTAPFAFAFAAVPEPASLVLLSIGTLAMILYSWRRRRLAAA